MRAIHKCLPICVTDTEFNELGYLTGAELSWMQQKTKKLQLFFKNYDLCEYVKFGAISWKVDILSITA